MKEIYLERYGWKVYVWYAGSPYFNIGEVLDRLHLMGCEKEFMERAANNMERGNMNSGLTYTNMARQGTAIVIGEVEDEAEEVNSVAHEVHHAVAHICEKYGVDLASEEACYLSGELAERIWRERYRKYR